MILTSADVGVGIVCADDIDRYNILQATLLAMRQAILDLTHPPGLILVDGTHTPALDIPCQAIIHGDQRSYVISCASIVAKVVRDRLMRLNDALIPHYACTRH